jgi:PEP-CTERM motif
MRFRKIRWAPLGFCVFCVLAATPAHADMILQYSGVTAAGSSLAGNPIGLGTPFEIDSSFPVAMYSVTTGIASVNVDSIAIDVGGADYSAIIDSTNPSEHYSVELLDPTNPYYTGFYVAAMGGFYYGNLFLPEYTVTTPTLDVLNPTDTVFSGFSGDISGSTLTFDTSAGSLVVTYDPGTSLDASITSPEPGTFGLLGAAFAGLALLRRRA